MVVVKKIHVIVFVFEVIFFLKKKINFLLFFITLYVDVKNKY
jgi:hypothetical protein